MKGVVVELPVTACKWAGVCCGKLDIARRYLSSAMVDASGSKIQFREECRFDPRPPAPPLFNDLDGSKFESLPLRQIGAVAADQRGGDDGAGL
jgi:hypothetical protein